MPKLMDMIEAYGQAMADGKKKLAASKLAQIGAALDDRAEDEFEGVWEELRGVLNAGAPNSPEFIKELTKLVWWRARSNLALGQPVKPRLDPRIIQELTPRTKGVTAASRAPSESTAARKTAAGKPGAGVRRLAATGNATAKAVKTAAPRASTKAAAKKTVRTPPPRRR